MDFEEKANVREEDAVMEYEGGFRLVCDPKSLLYLFGMEVRPSQQKAAWVCMTAPLLEALSAAYIWYKWRTIATAAMLGSVCHKAAAAVRHPEPARTQSPAGCEMITFHLFEPLKSRAAGLATATGPLHPRAEARSSRSCWAAWKRRVFNTKSTRPAC